MRTKRFIGAVVPLLALLVLLPLVTAGCGGGVVKADELAPAFSGKTLSGQAVSSTLYRGKPLVLAFMASW
jgi:hypothetical protein